MYKELLQLDNKTTNNQMVKDLKVGKTDTSWKKTDG